MDNNYTFYIKKFQIALIILGISVVGLVALVAKSVPNIQKINSLKKSYKSTVSALNDAERKLENLKTQAERQEEIDSHSAKVFFKPISEGLDTEGAISDEFGEILQLMKENKIKTRSVNYEYDPQDDNFVKNAINKFHVCRITAEMIASYSDFENFLRDLYKHEHFLEISKIEIIPYEKNKKILLISFQIKLYAQRDPSSVVELPKEENSAENPQALPQNVLPPEANQNSQDEF